MIWSQPLGTLGTHTMFQVWLFCLVGCFVFLFFVFFPQRENIVALLFPGENTNSVMLPYVYTIQIDPHTITQTI